MGPPLSVPATVLLQDGGGAQPIRVRTTVEPAEVGTLVPTVSTRLGQGVATRWAAVDAAED